MYENVETVRVVKYGTDVNTDEKVPIEVVSDYKPHYVRVAKGSDVNKIKNAN